jgi:methylated-DNA-[protein]-cysteine S-methyltransferase
MIYTTDYQTDELGKLILAADDEALVGAWFEGQRYFGDGLVGQDVQRRDDAPALKAAVIWLDRYFADERPDVAELALAPRGSEFRTRVWELLLQIPYGETRTYGDIVQELLLRDGQNHSARAVGGAVGHNPISIIIPCHRVVGASGSLTGYAGGVRRKAWLLEHEGVDLSRFTVPETGTVL